MLAALTTNEISARELLDLHLARIAEVNPELNAIVSLDADRARAAAAVVDETPLNERGPLAGLPFAVKDTHELAGWPTTYGSRLRVDHVPESDELLAERLRKSGVVFMGRTNVPEFAAGSHTFNEVFGVTRNPWNPGRSAGGSSGGAGSALAAGMVPLADGSDMGGSLRNPASFNGVVGLRPSLGRVPEWPMFNRWEILATGGPMARTVDDLALLLGALAGPDPRAPGALQDPGRSFAAPVRGNLVGVKVGFSVDLGGLFEVDEAVAAVIEAAVPIMSKAGAAVSSAAPDLSRADNAFRTLRAWHFQATMAALLVEHPGVLKPSLEANIRAGEPLSGADVAQAFADASTISENMRTFFETYDVLALPTSQVPPFPVEQEFPETINGRPQPTYLDWMKSCYLISVTGCPAISVPAGFTPDGLPIGIQLVGPHGSDRRLLEIAAGFEQATGLAGDHPSL